MFNYVFDREAIIQAGALIKDCPFFGPSNSSEYQVSLSASSGQPLSVKKMLDLLQIKYTEFEAGDWCINEVIITFGQNVDVKTIFYLTFMLHSMIKYKKVYLYLMYDTIPETAANEIVIGSFPIEETDVYTNISKCIYPEEILKLDIKNFSKNDLNQLFPNVRPDETGICKCIDWVENLPVPGTRKRYSSEDDTWYLY